MSLYDYMQQRATAERLRLQQAGLLSPYDVLTKATARSASNIPEEVEAGNTMVIGSDGVSFKDQPKPQAQSTSTGTQAGTTAAGVGAGEAVYNAITSNSKVPAAASSAATAAAEEAAPYGPTVGGGNLADSALTTMGGAGPTAGMALAAALAAQNIYESGGRQIASGEGKAKDYVNTALNTNPITGWINPATKALGLGTVGKALFSGGEENRVARDGLRRSLTEAGFFASDNPSDVTKGHSLMVLADGSTYDVGDEGFQVDEGGNVLSDSAGNRLRAYDVSMDAKYGAQAIAWNAPLASVLTGNEDANLTSHLNGYLANGSMSNAKTIEGVRANALMQIARAGYTQDTLKAQLEVLHTAKKLNDTDYASFINQVDMMFKGDPKSYVLGSIAETGGAAAAVADAATAAAPASQTGGRPAAQLTSGAVYDAIKQAMAKEG